MQRKRKERKWAEWGVTHVVLSDEATMMKLQLSHLFFLFQFDLLCCCCFFCCYWLRDLMENARFKRYGVGWMRLLRDSQHEFGFWVLWNDVYVMVSACYCYEHWENMYGWCNCFTFFMGEDGKYEKEWKI